jgi:(4S)-4-hydroxy-5-phosphonooxypentane-2,3-dione isomerase
VLVVHVYVSVKPDCVEAFKLATLANARCSVKEPGIARFEIIQALDDATQFVLEEIYRTEDATKAHKETAHYKAWRDAVEPMMAKPRSSRKFTDVG